MGDILGEGGQELAELYEQERVDELEAVVYLEDLDQLVVVFDR